MKKNFNKKKVAIISIIVLTAIALGIGLTYAYFTADVEGNDTASTINAKSGKLVIDFTTSAYINNTNGQLIPDANRDALADHTDFSIKHASNSKKAATYELMLTDIVISNNLKNSQDFKWELLKCQNTCNNISDYDSIYDGNFRDAEYINTNGVISFLITDEPQSLALGNTDNYVFRVWLSETEENQEDLSNGTFRGKISLEAKSV